MQFAEYDADKRHFTDTFNSFCSFASDSDCYSVTEFPLVVLANMRSTDAFLAVVACQRVVMPVRLKRGAGKE